MMTTTMNARPISLLGLLKYHDYLYTFCKYTPQLIVFLSVISDLLFRCISMNQMNGGLAWDVRLRLPSQKSKGL